MRIVHIAEYVIPAFGYQEFLLPKWNAKRGHEVYIVTSDRYSQIPNYSEVWEPILGPRIRASGVETCEGVEIIRLPVTWEWRNRAWLRGLRRTLRELNPDVIFCHGTTSPNDFRTALLARYLKTPVVMDTHMIQSVKNSTPVGRVYYRALRWVVRAVLVPNVSSFFSLGKEYGEFLTETQGIPPRKIRSLPFGVDTDVFQPRPEARRQLRRDLGIPEDAVVLMQTGKLEPVKGPHLFTEAAAPLLQGDGRVWLVLLGSGPEAYLQRVVKPLADAGVIGRLVRIGFVNVRVLANYYSMADVCVYPSEASISTLEAAVCGCVVIMNDLPQNRWSAQMGTGVCYKQGDIGDLRRSLKELLANTDRLRQLGARARDSMLTQFTYDKVAELSELHMSAAIAGRGH